jgi:hypothetical protein
LERHSLDSDEFCHKWPQKLSVSVWPGINPTWQITHILWGVYAYKTVKRKKSGKKMKKNAAVQKNTCNFCAVHIFTLQARRQKSLALGINTTNRTGIRK